MRLPGKVAAAIDILGEILTRHRPASEALKDWGKSHRFAGSGDRHAIGTLVYDSLRNRNSAAHAMQDESARGIAVGTLKTVWHLSAAEIITLGDDQHWPQGFSSAEKTLLAAISSTAPDHIAGNYPQWLDAALRKQFGELTLQQMQALASRAPVDVRVNTLKAQAQQVLEALRKFGAVAGPHIASSVRIAAPGPDDRHANVEAEPAHGMGYFEVQDTASQIAAAMSGVAPVESVLDLCAGAGGKTLALAALMQNQGKLIAHDRDKHRLRPIFERMNRSGASLIEVLGADQFALIKEHKFDCVVIDAPCSGSGAWRRNPESKWKLTPKLLDQRLADQAAVLATGATLVRPGGRMVYITCSILPQENTAQIEQFLSAHKEFRVIPYTEQWQKKIGSEPVISLAGHALLLTPYSHMTDGFFVCVMQKAA